MGIIKNYLNMSVPRINDESSVQEALEVLNRTGAKTLFIYDGDIFKGAIEARDLAGYPLTRLVSDCKTTEHVEFRENDTIEDALLTINKVNNPSNVIFDHCLNPVGIIDFGKFINELILKAKKDTDENDDEKLMERISDLENKAQLSNLFIGLVHDINNIMTAVSGYTDLAIFENKSSEEYPQKQKIACRLKNIKTAVDRCAQYLLNVSDLAIEKDVVEILNISDEINNVIELFSPVMSRSNIGIEIDFFNSEIMVSGNRSNVFNIVSNLLKNSKEAICENGTIFVKIDELKINEVRENEFGFKVEPGNYIELQITDNGEGISTENMSKIFNPFFTTKEKGTGIGLINVKREVEEMKGFIEVKSEKGVGSCFSIFLPKADNQQRS